MDVNAIEYMSMAKQAADEFLRSQTDLNDAIAKIATARQLSQVQIQRVVELANHEVNDELRKVAEDKTFCFDVATLDGVLGSLNESGDELPKVAAQDLRETVRSYIGRDTKDQMFEALRKEAYLHPTRAKLRVKNLMDNLVKIAKEIKVYGTELDAKIAGIEADLAIQLDRMADDVVTHIAEDGKFSDLKKFACSAFPDDGQIWDAVFGHLYDQAMSKLANSYLVKKLKRDKNVPSDEIDVEVINGVHRYQVELDTIKNKISEVDRYAKRRKLMDTLGPAVVTMIREFKNSKDVDDYVFKEVEKFKRIIGDRDKYFDRTDVDPVKLASAANALAALLGGKEGIDFDPRALSLMALMGRSVSRPFDLTHMVGNDKGLNV